MYLNLCASLVIFKKYLNNAGYKGSSINIRLTETEYFFEYLQKHHQLTDLRDVTSKHIRDYMIYLHKTVSPTTEKPYSKNTIRAKMGMIKLLFKCLYLNECIIINPAQDVVYKYEGDEGRREVMTEQQIAEFLDSIVSLRDKAMFELMYSSGLRRSEVANLDIADVDFNNRMLLIRNSKWDKDRVVPISEVACTYLKKYLRQRSAKHKALFTGSIGRIGSSTVGHRFKELLREHGLDKKHLSSHSVRHSTATHLLQHGADIRYVQELLGHESIATTVRYTHMLYDNLKRVYKSFHPRENQYYKEVDQEYENRIEIFLKELKRVKFYNRRPEVKMYKRRYNRKIDIEDNRFR